MKTLQELEAEWYRKAAKSREAKAKRDAFVGRKVSEAMAAINLEAEATFSAPIREALLEEENAQKAYRAEKERLKSIGWLPVSNMGRKA